MNTMEKYLKLKEKKGKNYWEERILAQLGYLIQLRNGEIPEDAAKVIDHLYQQEKEEGAITKQEAAAAENKLLHYKESAKKLSVICAGHAHIDMNWMWGYQETVSVTIDTFQTMLNLMREYEDFTFSQSQASTYEAIEKYCPDMLPEIREQIKRGKWEVTASTWVEPDKNMTGTESMARHILYTKNYLSGLLELPKEAMELDFEPDTFGHSACVPEILNQGGIKYYYHCRGFDKYMLYNWEAPSGERVLVYREPTWYLGPIEYDMMLNVPDFSRENHTSTMLKVYGVGDHGGGPTRRDIERIMDMSSWPLMPDIRFGTMHEFFHAVEKDRDRFPVVTGELNYVLTGCYTTQARIKMANRIGEDKLYDAETLCTMGAQLTGNRRLTDRLDRAWKNVLFNQFHDILPGSGVIETREHAMGLFQETLTISMANANRAMRAISERIDTSIFGGHNARDSMSEGAGVGYGTGQTEDCYGNEGDGRFGFSSTHRGSGDTRVYTLFNTTQYLRKELVEITVWDPEFPVDEITVVDEMGREVPWEIKGEGLHYWQHHYLKLLFMAEVGPFGYASYCVKHTPAQSEKLPVRQDPRVHDMEDGAYILENDRVRAVFDTRTMKLVSFAGLNGGKELIDDENPSAYFRYVEESDTEEMTAWIVGRYSRITDVNEQAFVRVIDKKLTGLNRYLTYELEYGKFKLKVKISLNGDDTMLRYKIKLDWLETGAKNKKIPQLQFYTPFGYEAEDYLYDIPAGSVVRKGLGHDVPAVYYGAPLPKIGDTAMMLTSDCKYGYRGGNQALLIDLVRGSFDPDPYPDLGEHYINIGIGFEKDYSREKLLREAILFSHPVYALSCTVHEGKAKQRECFLKVTGNAKVSSMKAAEDGSNAVVIRLYSCSEAEEPVSLKFLEKPISAKYTSLTENECADTAVEMDGCEVRVTLPKYAFRSIKVSF